MKTNNKNKVTLLTLCLLSALTYILGSCSGDNDLTGSNDLSINMQIPTTRSADPEAPQFWNSENKTPVNEDECGLFALTEVKKKYPNRGIDGYDSVSEYYKSMNDYAQKNYGYKGGAMDIETLYGVGKHYGLFTDSLFFSSENEPGVFFSNKENQQNAKIVCFQKEGQDHYAKYDGIDKEGRVKYYDSDGYGSIDPKEVEGVMYDDK